MTNLSQLIAVLIAMESSDNDRAVSPDGDCAGCLQLKREYVDDVNRILGRKKFWYAERYDRTKSIQMFRIEIGHYLTAERLGHEMTWRDVCAFHNQGWTGMHDPAKQGDVQKYLQRCVEEATKKGIEL